MSENALYQLDIIDSVKNANRQHTSLLFISMNEELI